jgi:molecular chaperone HtpG
MNLDPHQTALMIYLEANNKAYYGKVLELRNAVEGWLSYIPQTFPHYTRHTIKHSEEIVVQLSKLLFKNDDPKQPVTQLSPAEAYILIAAAYLHDAGMVAADKEKLEILTSNPEWKNWISGEGGGAKRWREIEEIRRGNENLDEATRHFVADLQTRFLIAEFIRRSHHLRAADVIKQYQNHLGRFAFGDLMMQRTIADICVSHGLRHYELEDKEKFPEKRDIQGYSVNVRLLAILLRLGDLLDMSYDRACPMLMNAASPLPADSYAHWEQYDRITHRSTSPNRIEVTAECEKQEEHRVLQDWCQWIVDEVREARILMSRTELHSDWQPPEATIDAPGASIIVRPAPGAKYIPSKWTFELDNEAIFQRLVRDVYDDPLVFIRELIQNALDADRSQMYADLMKAGAEPPEYPTQVEETRRQRYPVQVNLEVRKVKNKYSGEEEDRQVLVVDDTGIGMDKEIIKKYFLQVGRSYYTTDEFRRKFRFIATSRFGVGFLSAFAVSDNVTVDTYKPDSPHHDEPIRLILTGPRNYLLTEKSERLASGTRIEVELRDALPQGKLTELVANWCRRVEFPIFVDDLGARTCVTAERSEQFTYEIPNVSKEGRTFIVRSFPSDIPGIEGEFYVFASVDEIGERWDQWSYANYSYRMEYPQASTPTMPNDLICLHGISLTEENYYMFGRRLGFTARLDYRGGKYNPTLSRISRAQEAPERHPEVVAKWKELLLVHLSTSAYANAENGWSYKQRLINIFPFTTFWSELPGTIPFYEGKRQHVFSMQDLQKDKVLLTVASYNEMTDTTDSTGEGDLEAVFVKFAEENGISDGKVILAKHAAYLSAQHVEELFNSRQITDMKWITHDLLQITWRLCEDVSQLYLDDTQYDPLKLATIPFSNVIGIKIGFERPYSGGMPHLNDKHEFTKWLIRIDEASSTSQIKREQFMTLIELVKSSIKFPLSFIHRLNSYLQKWLEIENLPSELYPPLKEITLEMITPKRYGE